MLQVRSKNRAEDLARAVRVGDRITLGDQPLHNPSFVDPLAHIGEIENIHRSASPRLTWSVRHRTHMVAGRGGCGRSFRRTQKAMTFLTALTILSRDGR